MRSPASAAAAARAHRTSTHVNVAAYGGQYGVYFTKCEPAPVVAGGVFINQTKSGLFLGGKKAQGPLVVAGARVVLAPTENRPAPPPQARARTRAGRARALS